MKKLILKQTARSSGNENLFFIPPSHGGARKTTLYLFKEVYEEMFITRSSCREERSFVCMSVYEDSVVCTIPLSFIEEHVLKLVFPFCRLTLP